MSILGLRLECTGGDGIEFHVSERVSVTDVVVDRAFRNGISAVGVVQMLVVNSTFANTFGTSPGAGVDIEPAGGPVSHRAAYEDEIGIVFRGCHFPRNFGPGISLAMSHLTNTSDEISILFENCTVIGESPEGQAPSAEPELHRPVLGRANVHARGASPHAVLVSLPPNRGAAAHGHTQSVIFRDLLVVNRSGAGLYIPDKSPAGASVLFERARFERTASATPAVMELGDPHIAAGGMDAWPALGGLNFTDVTVVDPQPRQQCRPFLTFLPVCTETRCMPLKYVHGRVRVEGNGAECCAAQSGPAIPGNVSQVEVDLSFDCA